MVEMYRDALGPVLAVIGRIALRELTVQDVRSALACRGQHRAAVRRESAIWRLVAAGPQILG